jgi:phenylpropionate dioxygenase-like ring-hydroxylating dioxygenase large terminal subunit
MTYLRNAWYLGAWDYEVTRDMLARSILEESVLFFRSEDGSAVALSNSCPHRMAPLNKGQLRGDSVECPYHGLVFNRDGKCILNPHPGGKGPVPNWLRLRKYPVVERDGAVWLWAGVGEADTSLIPDYHWIADTRNFRTTRGVLEIACNYQSVADNVLDLTHLSFVHPGGLGPNLSSASDEHLEHVVDGTAVWCKRAAQGVKASIDFQMLNPRIRDAAVDKKHDVRWLAPSHSLISVHYVKAGTQSTDATGADIGHMATPISPTRTRLFWSISRNFLLDSTEVDQMVEKFARIAIDGQDAVIMEEQQRMMGTASDIDLLKPVAMPNDISVNRARRMLRKLIENEQGARSSVVRAAEDSNATQPAPEVVA